jgi:multiple sugar transport system ATP-binding protein
LRAYADKTVVVGLRPEHLSLAPEGGAAGQVLAVDTELVEALGSEQLLHFKIDARRIQAPGVDEEKEVGEAVLGIGVARIAPDGRVAAGERVRLAARPELMHLFDPATGEAIRG